MTIDRVRWKLLQALHNDFIFHGLAHGGLTLKQIAKRCDVEVPVVEWLVKRLESEGLIWRSVFIEGVDKVGITYDGSNFVNKFVFQEELSLAHDQSTARMQSVV